MEDNKMTGWLASSINKLTTAITNERFVKFMDAMIKIADNIKNDEQKTIFDYNNNELPFDDVSTKDSCAEPKQEEQPAEEVKEQDEIDRITNRMIGCVLLDKASRINKTEFDTFEFKMRAFGKHAHYTNESYKNVKAYSKEWMFENIKPITDELYKRGRLDYLMNMKAFEHCTNADEFFGRFLTNMEDDI